MTYEEWVETFQPIKNTIDANASYDGTMFETFGDELEFVRNQPDDSIWTLISSDECTTIGAGYHFVNRMGYFVTSHRWADNHSALEIVLDESDSEPCDDGTHCCCCQMPGEPCCDCSEVPVRASEVLSFLDFFAGQENTAEEVRDFVQLAARLVHEGKTREAFRAHGDPLIGFVEWCEEQESQDGDQPK